MPSRASQSTANFKGDRLSVKMFGAQADGVIVTDGVIAGGSLSTLTSATARFKKAAVGQSITIDGAGAAGANFTTTIHAYVSPSEVTFTAAASTPVTGARALWGSDNATAINKAIAFMADYGGGTVFVPAGLYVIGSIISMASNVKLRGAGIDSTTLIVQGGSNDTCSCLINLKFIAGAKVSSMTLDGNAVSLQSTNAHSAIYMSAVTKCVIDRVRTTNTGWNSSSNAGGVHIYIQNWEPGDPLIDPTGSSAGPSYGNSITNCILDDPTGLCAFGIRCGTNFDYNLASGSFVNTVRGTIVRGNTLTGFGFVGIGMYGPGTISSSVVNNVVDDCFGIIGWTFEKGASFNTATGNTFGGFAGTSNISAGLSRMGMRIAGFPANVGGTHPERIAIGNVMSANSIVITGPITTGAGIGMMMQYCISSTFAGNVVTAATALQVTGVFIEQRVDACSVVKNTLSGVQIGIGSVAALTISDSYGLVIKGNTIQAVDSGILVVTTSGSYMFREMTIDGNTINGVAGTGVASNPLSFAGIWFGSTVGGSTGLGNIVKNNTIRDAAYAIWNSGDSSTIKGNTVLRSTVYAFRNQSTGTKAFWKDNTCTVASGSAFDNSATDTIWHGSIVGAGFHGIGTATPLDLLTVQGADNQGVTVSRNISPGVDGQRAAMRQNIGNGGYFFLVDPNNIQTVEFLGFGDSYITGGKLGIGTKTPADLLSVNSTVDNLGMSLYRGGSQVGGIRHNLTLGAYLYLFDQTGAQNISITGGGAAALPPSNANSLAIAAGGLAAQAVTLCWGAGTGWHLVYGTKVAGVFTPIFDFSDTGVLNIYNTSGTLVWSSSASTSTAAITALTGDVTAAGPGSAAATLANTAVSAGVYGTGSSIPQITIDAKGRITTATTVAVSPAAGGLLAANNLSDVANATTSRNNLSAAPQTAGIGGTIHLAKLTSGGTNGSITIGTQGNITAWVDPT